MNKYDLPLVASSRQTILPVMTKDGHVRGWYPIAAQTFTGAERTFTLSDTGNGGSGTVVPITTVTVDKTGNNGVSQYMAAVWPTGLAKNYHPWASTLLQKPDAGYYRWYSMSTESWFLHFGGGALIDGLSGGTLNLAVSAVSNPAAPSVTPLALNWQASVEFAALNGDCPFLDFNWLTLFKVSSADPATRIVVVSNPAPIAPDPLPPIVASVIGIPTATANGTLYDTVRLMKLGDIVAGTYVFNFRVYDTFGQFTAVALTLTVV